MWATVQMQQKHHVVSVVAHVVLVVLARTLVMVSPMQFTYQAGGADFTLQPTSGSVQPSWSNNRLWLTPDPDITLSSRQSGSVGRVVYNHPLSLFNASQVVSFNTSFNFTILTDGPYGLSGDGLAFAISSILDFDITGSGGDALGIATDIPGNATTIPARHLFAVEFDTYQNPPLSDPSSSHIGIDLNSLKSSATFDSNNSESDLYLYNNYTIFAWVQYVAPLHQILVFAANSSDRPSQPCLNVTYDLSDIFSLNQSLYAAISAASGVAVQGTALFSWSFASEDISISTSLPASPLRPSHSLPSPPSPPPHPHSLALVISLSLLGMFLLAAACALVALLQRRKKHMFPAVIEMIPPGELVPRHSYHELRKATQGFSDKQKIGAGGFSNVYKGTLSTGDVVAVKRLKEGLRMEEEFASEIQIISQIRHRNLLQLRGWGYEKGEALLVYQYMPNGSLDTHLFGKRKGQKELMDGEKRFSILVDIAAALEYLHEGLGDCVLHRDVKAANVMLTESFQAMLGDFGLARLITHNQVVTMTAVGTPGYVAPEVVYTGKATDRADVYSFGILALEVACGRRALDDSRQPKEMLLLDWVWQLQQSGKLLDALDSMCFPPVKDLEQQQHIQTGVGNCITDKSEGEIAEEPLVCNKTDLDHMVMKEWAVSVQDLKWRCVLHVALLCCNPWPEDRPTMQQVHQTLREHIVLPLPSIRPTYGRSASIRPTYGRSASSIAKSSSQFSTSSSSSSALIGHSSSPSTAPSSQLSL